MKKQTITVELKDAKIKLDLTEEELKKILGANFGKIELANVEPGEIVHIGKYDWIVLEQSGDTTALLMADTLCDMPFDNDSSNYVSSNIRNYLNTKFYQEMKDELGDNIVLHTVNLNTDDGTPKYTEELIKDYFSLISTETYRKYRKFIKPLGKWWWTCTPMSTESWLTFVRIVGNSGTLDGGSCDYGNGVRPFCILKSNIFVSKKGE